MNVSKIKAEKVDHELEYRKIQGIVGDHSLCLILPKKYALDLGIGKGDFVKVYQNDRCIVVEKA